LGKNLFRVKKAEGLRGGKKIPRVSQEVGMIARGRRRGCGDDGKQ